MTRSSGFELLSTVTMMESTLFTVRIIGLSTPCSLYRKAIRHLRKPITNSLWRLLSQPVPDFQYARPLSGEHAVLKTIQALPMNWGKELASDQ